MRFEKKHKIYAGLVGAALLAWAIDAAFFGPAAPAGSPAAASAAASPNAPEPSIVPQQAPVAAPEIRNDKWLSDRLRDWSKNNPIDPAQVRDVFSPPVSWTKPSAPTPTSLPVATIAQEFTRNHHLSAVVLSTAGGSAAVIDGRLLHVGQTVGGCRLVGVRRGSADLLGPDGQQFRVVIGTEDAGNAR